MIQTFFGKIFGTSNDRELKKYFKRVKKINALEQKYKDMSDEELQNSFSELKQQVLSEEKTLDDVLNEQDFEGLQQIFNFNQDVDFSKDFSEENNGVKFEYSQANNKLKVSANLVDYEFVVDNSSSKPTFSIVNKDSIISDNKYNVVDFLKELIK